MLIKYVGGSTIRLWGEREWSPKGNHVLEVDEPEVVADLLTHPPGDFTVAPEEPLLLLSDIKLYMVAGMALAGVATLAALGQAEGETIKRLAEACGREEKQIKDWVKQAQKLLVVEQEEVTHGDNG